MGNRLYYFAGGGTGGHLFPGIAIAEDLRTREPDARIVFVGSDRPIEHDILAGTSFEHLVLPVAGLAGQAHNSWRSMRRFWASYRAAQRLIDRDRPAIVIGCGGFASVPTVLAAWRRGVPVILLEQNVIPGRANRWLSRLALATCLSFEQTAARLPRRATTHFTGNPVRAAIAELAEQHRPLTKETRTLLILGGSQGARAINELVLSFAAEQPASLSGWQIIHQTGQQGEQEARETYSRLQLDATVAAFFDDSAALYRQADLAVTRAGGTTLAELACAGIPAVLIPYPHATANHQWHNAEAFRAAGGAVLLDSQQDAGSLPSRFREALLPLVQDESARKDQSSAMSKLGHPQAAADVSELIDELLTRRGCIH